MNKLSKRDSKLVYNSVDTAVNAIASFCDQEGVEKVDISVAVWYLKNYRASVVNASWDDRHWDFFQYCVLVNAFMAGHLAPNNPMGTFSAPATWNDMLVFQVSSDGRGNSVEPLRHLRDPLDPDGNHEYWVTCPHCMKEFGVN